MNLAGDLTAVIVNAAAIKPRDLEPLWPGVLWIGKPTLLVGDPGLGKSLATVDIAARVSKGAPWPCSSERAPPGDVIMVSGEDDSQDTIVPRLIAAGADLTRVSFLTGIHEHDSETGESRELWVTLDQHLEQLGDVVRAKGGSVRLVVIDPIGAFLGATDSHKNAEVRAVLAGLGRLASELRFAVLVVSHLNKGSGTNPVYRITGSLAFVAAARCVFAIAKDPEDAERRLLLPIKSNLGPDTEGYAYTIGIADNDAPVIRWGDEKITKSADEILGGVLSPREQAVAERVGEVQTWLRGKLEHGAQPASSIWHAAKAIGYSERDVERAKRAIGVRSAIKGFGGNWHWETQ